MSVIVTVIYGSDEKKDWVDLELPTDVQVGELIPIMVETLEEHLQNIQDRFVLEIKNKNSNWEKMNEKKTLQNYGVMDGFYLRIQRKPLEEEKHDDLAEQLGLIEKEEINGILETWKTDG